MKLHRVMCLSLSLLLFALILAPGLALAAPNVEGKWHASWMARIMTLSQNGNKVTGSFGTGTLEGTFAPGSSVLNGTWRSNGGVVNQFQFVFNGDKIVNGFWDRGEGYAYNRQNGIQGNKYKQ